MKNEVMKKLYSLLEEKRVFISRRNSPAKLARAAGVSRKELEEIVFDSTGMSLYLVLELYRIQNARELLVQGFDYETVWTLSGFASGREMERALEAIVG